MSSNEPAGTNSLNTECASEWITLGETKLRLLPAEVAFDSSAGRVVIDDLLLTGMVRNRSWHFEDDALPSVLRVMVNGHDVLACVWSARLDDDGYLGGATLVIDGGADDASKATYVAMLKSLAIGIGEIDYVFISLSGNRVALQSVVVMRVDEDQDTTKCAMRADCLFANIL